MVSIVERNGYLVDTLTGECVERAFTTDEQMNFYHCNGMLVKTHEVLSPPMNAVQFKGKKLKGNSVYSDRRTITLYHDVLQACRILDVTPALVHRIKDVVIKVMATPEFYRKGKKFGNVITAAIFMVENEQKYQNWLGFVKRCNAAGVSCKKDHLIPLIQVLRRFITRPPIDWQVEATRLYKAGDHNLTRISRKVGVHYSVVAIYLIKTGLHHRRKRIDRWTPTTSG